MNEEFTNYLKEAGFSFNRYMVECESFKSWQMMCLAVVLIDTWWNVNSNEEALNRYMAYVLIDTWWNANCTLFPCPALRTLRFNRYMVECECSTAKAKCLRNLSFNRYMVECE